MEMSKSCRLRLHDLHAIDRLVGECRDLGDDSLAWRDHGIAQLARLTDADLGHLGEMAGCRALEPKDLGVTWWGWRTGCRALMPEDFGVTWWGWQNGFVDEHTNTRTHEHSPAMIVYFRKNLVEPGVCHSRRQFIADRDWYASHDYQVIQRTFGVDNIAWCFRRLSGAASDECSGIILNREKGKREFSARDRALVQELNASFTPLIGGPLARFSDPSPLDLTPRVREVLACLLEGDGNKQIAARLSLSSYTINEYTKVLYKHFRVRSRPELLARWIRRGWGNRFFWAD
jgi:DNA-binding CsgD family transcriptional regulator